MVLNKNQRKTRNTRKKLRVAVTQYQYKNKEIKQTKSNKKKD